MKKQDKILLPFSNDCLHARLVQRVKRFSVEFTTSAGENLWAHTNNSGSMLGLIKKGSEILLSPAKNPNRKLHYTLEMINIGNASHTPLWVGVNTITPNKMLHMAFKQNLLPWAKGYTHFTPEVKRGDSRIDALLEGQGLPPLWVECKNVTMVEDGVAAFPDAPTVRGQKHLATMMDIAKNGERAAFFYMVQREDAECFAPADYIDVNYTKLFYEALAAKVEVYPYKSTLSTSGIGLGSLLPLAPKTCYSE